MHGKGSYMFAEGNLYEGYFKEDQFIYGRCMQADGKSMLKGQFKGWVAHGLAVRIYQDGRICDGQYFEGFAEEEYERTNTVFC